nr:hypothetical protein [Akkermansiaceae bacterium]
MSADTTPGAPRPVAGHLARRAARAFVLGLAGLWAGCGIVDSDGSGWEKDLAEARQLWRDASLTDYDYRVRQLCFCGFGGAVIAVEVRGGEVVAATDTQSGEAIPLSQFPWAAPSVEDLFQRIEDILEGGPAEFTATYDPLLGYPRSVSSDPIANAIDDEWGVEASDVEAMA